MFNLPQTLPCMSNLALTLLVHLVHTPSFFVKSKLLIYFRCFVRIILAILCILLCVSVFHVSSLSQDYTLLLESWFLWLLWHYRYVTDVIEWKFKISILIFFSYCYWRRFKNKCFNLEFFVFAKKEVGVMFAYFSCTCMWKCLLNDFLYTFNVYLFYTGNISYGVATPVSSSF